MFLNLKDKDTDAMLLANRMKLWRPFTYRSTCFSVTLATVLSAGLDIQSASASQPESTGSTVELHTLTSSDLQTSEFSHFYTQYQQYLHSSIAIADFNGDGIDDVASLYGTSAGIGLLNVHFGLNAAGGSSNSSVEAQTSTQLTFSPELVSAGDFNGDGHADVLATSGETIHLLHGTGDGHFSHVESRSLPAATVDLFVADINQPDGMMDILVSTANSQVILFESAFGAWKAEAQSYELPGVATAITAAPIDDIPGVDIAIAVHDKLYLVSGREHNVVEFNGIETSPGPLSMDSVVCVKGIETSPTPKGIETSPTPKAKSSEPVVCTRGIETSPGPKANSAQSFVGIRGIETSPAPKGIATSPTPKGIETSLALKGIETSPSPKGIETSPAPKGIETSPTPKGIETSPVPKGIETSPAPKGIETPPTPKGIETSPAPKGIETSPIPQRTGSNERQLPYSVDAMTAITTPGSNTSTLVFLTDSGALMYMSPLPQEHETMQLGRASKWTDRVVMTLMDVPSTSSDRQLVSSSNWSSSTVNLLEGHRWHRFQVERTSGTGSLSDLSQWSYQRQPLPETDDSAGIRAVKAIHTLRGSSEDLILLHEGHAEPSLAITQ